MSDRYEAINGGEFGVTEVPVLSESFTIGSNDIIRAVSILGFFFASQKVLGYSHVGDIVMLVNYS